MSSKPADAGPSCRWYLRRVKRSSSTGARTGRSSRANGTKLQVAHTKLSHSRAFIVRAYPLQTHEMLFDALTQAFRVLGGVPQRGIFDNMKTAVDRIGSGKIRQINARFAAMASHYLFEPEFCNPASGWEKGQVEKNVQDARRRLWQKMPSLPRSCDALNAWLEERCLEQWARSRMAPCPARSPMCMPPSRQPDADGPSVRWLCRAYQAGIADLPRALRAQPLQRTGILREPAVSPADLSRPYRHRRRGQVLCEHPRIITRSHHLPGPDSL
jgi:hypothetical protein